MTAENEDTPTFTADYVKQLRDEAASWRNKLRETESELKNKDLAVEFAKRGIDADPAWLNVPEGMTAAQVVDQFQKVIQSEEQPTAATRPAYPKAQPPDSTKANASGPPPAQGAFGGRSLDEIKADPRAREEVRQWYREQLKKGTHGNEDSIYN